MRRYIVWNEDRSEGVVFTDRADAMSARTGKPNRRLGYSSMPCLAEAFHETYGSEGEPCHIEEVDL